MLLDYLLLAFGLAMFAGGGHFAKRAARRHEQRVRELRSGGEELYFEERRDLEAYPPFSKAWQWRLLGLLLMVAIVGRMLTH